MINGVVVHAASTGQAAVTVHDDNGSAPCSAEGTHVFDAIFQAVKKHCGANGSVEFIRSVTGNGDWNRVEMYLKIGDQQCSAVDCDRDPLVAYAKAIQRTITENITPTD